MTVKQGLTLSRVAVGRPGISRSRGLLLGEADDTRDFTARSESSPFHLAYIKNGQIKELLCVHIYLWHVKAVINICKKHVTKYISLHYGPIKTEKIQTVS